MILNIHKNCHDRVYIWSPSINVDSIWLPVKKYIVEEMKIDPDKEQCWFDEFKASDLESIINTQQKILEYCKKQGYKKLFNILVVLDDISDDPKVSRHNKLLNQLYVRGRHVGINVITSVQKTTTLPPIIRVNCTHMFLYKARNFKEIEILQDELSAVVRRNTMHESKNAIYKIYEEATNEPNSFLYVNLFEKDPNKMFMKCFDYFLTIDDN